MVRKEQPVDLAESLRFLGENLKATARRPNILGYAPHDKQIRFHKSTKKIRVYIGGNRSGKTTGGVCEDIWQAQGQHPYRKIPEPPIRGRIVTTDFLSGIAKNILPELARWTPISWLKDGSWERAYDKQERTLTFENGSFIELMSYEQDLEKFASTSRHFIHYDEEPPEDIYTECQTRLVDTGGESWLTMTPVEGMTWVFDKLYEPGISGERVNVDVIEVDMTENPYLNQGEVQSFISDLDDDDIKIRIKGQFVQRGGLIYKVFQKDTHVIKPFDVPKDWFWAASLDHGYNNPTAWLWHAVNFEGRIFTFHEHYKRGLTIDEHAKIVIERCNTLGKWPDLFIGDPSIRSTDPITGTSIFEEYNKHGLTIVLGNNDVKAGIVKTAGFLKPTSPKPINDGLPNLLVTSDCPETIKEYLRYRWKTFTSKKHESSVNVQEQPHKKDDHCMDSTRYFIMSRPDLTPSMPSSDLTADQVRNILGVSEAADPYNRKTDPNPVNTLGDFNRSPVGSEWVVDEYMGGEW